MVPYLISRKVTWMNPSYNLTFCSAFLSLFWQDFFTFLQQQNDTDFWALYFQLLHLKFSFVILVHTFKKKLTKLCNSCLVREYCASSRSDYNYPKELHNEMKKFLNSHFQLQNPSVFSKMYSQRIQSTKKILLKRLN